MPFAGTRRRRAVSPWSDATQLDTVDCGQSRCHAACMTHANDEAASTDASSQLAPMPEDWHRGLAIVAHPDDLEYGAAGAIAAWTQADREVTYVIATRGEAGIDSIAPEKSAPLREAEQQTSAQVVGVSTVEFLDYRDGVIEAGLPLRRDFAVAIRRYRPQLIVTLNHHDTWGFGGWNTADHRAVGRTVLDAVADAGNRWIFPELLERGLEPWNAHWVAVAGSPRPTHAVDVSSTLDKSVESLLTHHAYITGLTEEDPEQYAGDFLRGIAAANAARFGGRPSVAFELFEL